jgi:hypothetical protein
MAIIDWECSENHLETPRCRFSQGDSWFPLQPFSYRYSFESHLRHVRLQETMGSFWGHQSVKIISYQSLAHQLSSIDDLKAKS